ncbi:MAG: hypothetical protein RR977_01735 [Oscillospiraceae bacterium]
MMKLFKKLAAVAVTTVLAASMSAPAFAAGSVVTNTGNAPLTLTYKSVEEWVLKNNLQVKNNAVILANLKENRISADTQDTTSDVNGMINMTSNNLDSILANEGASADVKAIAESTKLTLSMLGTIFGSMAGTQNTQSNSFGEQMNLTKLQLEQANKQIITAAQNLFSVYHQLTYNVSQLVSSKADLTTALKTAQVQLSLGMNTKINVADMQKNITELDNNIADLNNQIKGIKAELNKMLGRSATAELTVGSLPAADLAYVKSIKVSEDVKKAVEQSYIIRYKKEELNNLKKHPDSNYQVSKNNRAMKENEISMETEAVKTSLQKQYDTIIKQQNIVAAQQQKLDTEKVKLTQAQKKYDLGVLSGMELKTQKNAVQTQESVLSAAKATLFSNVEGYRSIMNGLPAGQN